TGGTDNHLVLVDLTPKNVPGKKAAQALDKAGIVCNYNAIPFDPRKPFDPSGIRIGMSSVTSRGFGPDEVTRLASWVNDVVAAPEDEALLSRVEKEVKEMCDSFPAPGLPVDD